MTIFLDIALLLVVILLLMAVMLIIAKRIPKRLSNTQKNWWLIAHIMFVAIYLSGLFSTLLLTSITTTIVIDREHIHAAHLFGKYCDWFLIIPGAFGSLITGIWLAVRTNWGLTKFRWIMVKTFGHIGAILYGATLMRIWFDQTVALSLLTQSNFLNNPAYLYNRHMLIIGTIISLAILIFLVIISVFKPWGKLKNNLEPQNKISLEYTVQGKV